MRLEKKSLNAESLDMNVVVSQKKVHGTAVLYWVLCKTQFSPIRIANPGEFSTDSNSPAKILNAILNTLPHIFAPLIRI